MLYRPKYCANCSEKIERAHWGIFTSRRFCQVCESEYKGIDLVPRAVVAAGIIVGVLGVGGYLKSSSSLQPELNHRLGKLSERSNVMLERQPVALTSPSMPASSTPAPLAQTATNSRLPVKTPELRTEVAEPQFFCGAETKKGTPCSRRVKGNIRCYQHAGMPAMMTADKLKIN